MTKEIPLTQGKVALVDDEDFEWLSKYKWYYNGRYAVRSVYREDGKQRAVFLHRLILNLPNGIDGDHINGDKLDNRRSNLRPATRQQNASNSGLQRNNKSGFIGVYQYRHRWKAQVKYNGKHIRLGSFDSPEEAAKARDAKAKELFGEYARLNFPEGYGSA